MKKFIFLISIIIILVSCSMPSHHEQVLSYAEELLKNNPDSALLVLQKEKANYHAFSVNDKMHYLLLNAEAMNKTFMPMDTISSMEQVLDYYLSNGNKAEKARANYMMGAVCRDRGDSPRALEYYQDAVKDSDALVKNDHQLLYSIYSQMAYIYARQRYAQKLIEVSEYARNMALECGDSVNYYMTTDNIGQAYYMMNKEQLAYDTSLEAYTGLKKLKEDEKAARILGPLFAYLLKQKEFKKAKILMDEYEAMSGLWDKQKGPLQPGIEIHYYYLGQYYEGIGKQDSALWCYQKLAGYQSNIEALENAYKGMLSVYFKQPQIDSIVKYTCLYADANDTANIRNSAKNIIEMQALYNYADIQSMAIYNSQKSQRLWKTLVIILIVVLLCFWGLIFLYEHLQKTKKKNQETCSALNEKYTNTLCQNQDIQKKNEELEKIIQDYQDYSDEKKWNEGQKLQKLPIVQRMHALASHAQKATDEEWESLDKAVAKHLSSFYTSLSAYNSKINRKEYYICLLIKLNFVPSEIAVLLDMSPQVVSNKKSVINQKIFGVKSALTLDENISQIK